MRNSDRIPVFCEKLCELWKKVPDWRFGQLMVNLFGTVERDPFFIEDKELTTAEFFMLISNYVSTKYDYGLYQTGLQLDTISLNTININIKLFAIRYLIFIINDIIKICKMNNKDIEWLKNYICSVSKISKDICEKIIKYVNKYANEQSIEDEYELLKLL